MQIMPLNWGHLYRGCPMFYTEDKVTQPTINVTFATSASVLYTVYNRVQEQVNDSNSISVSTSLKPVDLYYNTNYIYLESNDAGTGYRLKDGDMTLGGNT